MRATFEREFQEYFNTMLGYVFVSAFLFLAGVFFSVNNINERPFQVLCKLKKLI